MKFTTNGNINSRGGIKVPKTNHDFAKFHPSHLGTQPRESDTNKGKKMNTKSNEHPDYVPPKG